MSADFFLNSDSDVIELELLEISHPNATSTYRYVRNLRAGVTVTLPVDGSTAFEFRPFVVRRSRSSDDIAQALSIDVGDPGNVLVTEMDAIITVDGYDVKPQIRFWTYRSDDLTTAMVGPLIFEVTSLSTKAGMATIEAQAPEGNRSSTGQLYTFNRFPMLRGEI